MILLNKFLSLSWGNSSRKSLPEHVAGVYSQLYGLKNARHFAWCRFGNDKTAYQSIIIDLNVDQRMLVMDEPFGLPKNFFWSPALPVSVEIKDYATRITFRSRFISLEPDEKANRMLLAWPDEVESEQRRSVFRINFHDSEQAPMIQIMDHSSELFPCLDLSFQGVGIAIPQDLADGIYVSQSLVVQLWLPHLEPILAKLTVKHLDPVANMQVCSLGGEIDGLDSLARRAIDKFLVTEQRKEIKSRAG